MCVCVCVCARVLVLVSVAGHSIFVQLFVCIMLSQSTVVYRDGRGPPHHLSLILEFEEILVHISWTSSFFITHS